MMKPVFLAMAILAACNASASAQVELAPKLTENATWRTTVAVKVDQVLTIAGMPLESKVSQNLIIAESAGKKGADGKLAVDAKMDAMLVEMDLPGGIKLAFDAGNPKTDAPIPQLQPILDLLKASSQATFTTTYSSPVKIDSLKFTNDALDSVDDALKGDFNPELLAQQAQQELNRLPKKAVKKGDKWERTENARVGGGQTFEFKKQYEYAGTTTVGGKTLDRITSTATAVTYSAEPNPASPLSVKESDLKITASKGEILFDRELGVVVSGSDEVTIEGELKLVINGMELPGKLKLTMTTNSKRGE